MVQESSYPDTRGPVDVVLSLHGPGAHGAKVSCPEPFVEVPKQPGRRCVRLHLRPDEVVSLVVDGPAD